MPRHNPNRLIEPISPISIASLSFLSGVGIGHLYKHPTYANCSSGLFFVGYLMAIWELTTIESRGQGARAAIAAISTTVGFFGSILTFDQILAPPKEELGL